MPIVGGASQYLWRDYSSKTHPTIEAAAEINCKNYVYQGKYHSHAMITPTHVQVTCNGRYGINVSAPSAVSAVKNPDYDPNAPTTEERYIPITVVAQQVISNAESGHAESKSLLVSIVSVLASMKFYDNLF